MNTFMDVIIGDTFTTKEYPDKEMDWLLEATDTDSGDVYPMFKKHVFGDLKAGRIAICVGKEFRVKRNGRWHTYNKGE